MGKGKIRWFIQCLVEDPIWTCIFCLFMISMFVYLIQNAMTDPTPKLTGSASEPTGSASKPNGTAYGIEETNISKNLFHCTWTLILDGESHLMHCGAICKRECGFCNPEFDGCFGKKYCPAKCKAGEPCDYSLGPANRDCEEFCTSENICAELPSPIPCGTTEKSFHKFMTAAYTLVFIVSFLLMRYAAKDDESRMLFIFMFCIPAAVADICSFALMGACLNSKTMYSQRMLLFAVVGLIITVLTGMYGSSVKKAGGAIAVVWFFTFWIDIMMSAIGNVHARIEAIGDPLFPFFAENKICSATEKQLYYSWCCIFGIAVVLSVAQLFTKIENKRLPFTIGQNKQLPFTIGLPMFVVWIVSIGFLGACTSLGLTILLKFAITISFFYVIFIGYIGYQIYLQGEGNRSLSEPLSKVLLFHIVGYIIIAWTMFIVNKLKINTGE